MFEITNKTKLKILNFLKNDLDILDITNIYKILSLIIFWTSLWLCISVQPEAIKYFGNNLIDTFNSFRISLPLILTFISSAIVLFIIFKKNNINKLNNIIFILYIYFLFQSIGLLLNHELKFTLGNSYLIVLGVGTLNILLIIKFLKIDKISKYLFFISLIILFSYLVVLICINFNKIDDFLVFSNFYSISKPGDFFLGQAYPRSTGISRVFGLIGITLIVINSEIKIKNLKYLFYLVIFICSLAVWGFQSRGTIICYFCSTLFVLVFFENKKILHKVFFYLLAPVIIFYTSTYLTQMAYKNNIVFKNLELVEETRKNLPKTEAEKNSLNEKNIIIINRFQQHGLQTSGRFEIWEYALKNYDKSKIFGYGVQGDRFILQDKYKDYGNNSSNLLLYAFVSGGYFSVIIFLIIYLKMLIILIKLKLNKLQNKFKEPLIYKVSLSLICFFFIRSIIENSFSLFSIDYLIVILCLFIVDDIYSKEKSLKI